MNRLNIYHERQQHDENSNLTAKLVSISKRSPMLTEQHLRTALTTLT